MVKLHSSRSEAGSLLQTWGKADGVSSHCLNHLLPDCRVCNNLPLRGHGFQLPTLSTVLHRNSFVTRSLYLNGDGGCG